MFLSRYAATFHIGTCTVGHTVVIPLHVRQLRLRAVPVTVVRFPSSNTLSSTNFASFN